MLDRWLCRGRDLLLRHQRFVFLVLLLLALLSRLAFAAGSEFPGIADQTHYYTVAENLVAGRGFEVDYLWNYLDRPAGLPHTSNDYWAPLPAAAMAGSMVLFGRSLLAALLPSLLLGLALALVTHTLAKVCGLVAPGPYYAAGLVFLLPALFFFSLRTDTAIYYAFFANLALLALLQGQRRPAFFLLAAAGVALAQLSRLDGVLLLVPLVVGILLAPHRRRWLYLLLALLVYVAVLSPWLVSNYRTLGTLLPSGPSKAAWLTDYEEIYSYSTELSPQHYLDWGVGNILWSKARAALQTGLILGRVLGPLLAILALLGLLLVLRSPERRRDWRLYSPPLLFLAALFGFYIVVATLPAEHGSFFKSVVALAPFLVILAVDALQRLVRSETARVLVLLLLALALLGSSWQEMVTTLRDDTARYRQLLRVGEFVRQEGAGPQRVVMTRYPWDVYYATRLRAIQVPNEDLETILAVAGRYGAEYLLLPVPREALAGIYAGTQQDPRLVLCLSLPDAEWKLFRIQPQE